MITMHGSVKNHPIKSLLSIILGTVYCNATLAATPPDAASTVTAPITKTPYTILTMKTGYTSSASTNFNTAIGCPTGFQPYVTVSSTRYGKSYNAFSGKKVCVVSATAGTNNVSVTFRTTTQYHTLANVKTRDYVDHDRWVSDNPDAWTVWDAQPMPVNYVIRDVATTENTPGDIFWTLYCYPSTLNRPAYNCPP